jgi:hypothetical protein
MYTLGSDYDSTEAKEFTPFETPPVGGYVFKVVEVDGSPSKGGRPMVSLGLDIAEGPYAGAFAKYPKTYRQMIDGAGLPYFKAMIKQFSESNSEAKMREVIFMQKNGTKGFDPMKLLGLRIGGNLGEAEYVKQTTGETKIGTEIRFLGAVKDVPLMKPLSLKKLSGSNGSSRPTGPAPTGGYPSDWDLPL